jgi:hypothetical protein
MRLCMQAKRFEMQAEQTLELRDGEGARTRTLSAEQWTKQHRGRVDSGISAGKKSTIERDGRNLLPAFRHSLANVHEPAGTRVGAAATLIQVLFGLVRYFCELGMKRSAWRDAYRI